MCIKKALWLGKFVSHAEKELRNQSQKFARSASILTAAVSGLYSPPISSQTLESSEPMTSVLGCWLGLLNQSRTAFWPTLGSRRSCIGSWLLDLAVVRAPTIMKYIPAYRRMDSSSALASG